MTFSPLQRAIVLTLSYSLQFEFPLSREEIKKRLIAQLDETGVFSLEPRDFSLDIFEQDLAELLEKKVVVEKGKWLSLGGFEDAFQVRERRAQIARQRQLEVEDFLKTVKRIPWIKAVFLTGALAVQNADLDEDVDFMIVTAVDRLWLTRLVVSVIAILKGKRRSRDREEKQSWCLNLWITEAEAAVFNRQPSLYGAYELLQAVAIFDRIHFESTLCQSNLWVRDFLPLSGWGRGEEQSGRVLKARSISVLSLILTGLDEIAYQFQLLYMKPHRTREVVTPDKAFFHPRDTENWIWGRWIGILDQVSRYLEAYESLKK